MAEYLIQGATLDAIANAINAKTGGSSAMTPAQMPTEIESIQTGGGGGLVLLADYTASEDVSAIRIDFTEAMRGYTYYIVEMNARFTGSSTPYIGMNTETTKRYYTQLSGSYIYPAMIYVYSSTKFALVGGNAAQVFDLPISYLHIRVFNTSSVIRTGATVKIWGVAE